MSNGHRNQIILIGMFQPQRLKEAAPESFSNIEISICGCVDDSGLDYLKNGLEKFCGPPSDYSLLETFMASSLDNKADVRIKWDLGAQKIDIASFGPKLKVTARPNDENPLMSVMSRYCTVLKNGQPDHIKGLHGAGFQRKSLLYHKGYLYRWGQTRITVSQVYAPASTKVEDFTKKRLHEEWFVKCTLLTSYECVEQAAAKVLELRKVLVDRVALGKVD